MLCSGKNRPTENYVLSVYAHVLTAAILVSTCFHSSNVGVPKLILLKLNFILLKTSSFVSIKNTAPDHVSELTL